MACETKDHYRTQYIKSVLEKPKPHRTKAEIKQVVEFLEQIQFFKDRDISPKVL